MSGFITAMVAIGVGAASVGVTYYQGEKQTKAIKNGKSVV